MTARAQNETFSVLFSLVPTDPNPQEFPGDKLERNYYKFGSQQTKIFTEIYKMLLPLHAAVNNFIKNQIELDILISDKLYDETSETLGKIAFRLCDYQEAERLFRKMTYENPQNALGWHNLGMSLLQLQKKEGMIEAFEKALQSDDLSVIDAVTISMNLGNAYGLLGNVQKKKELLKCALKVNEKYCGNKLVEKARILTNLGIAYIDLGDAKEAVKLLEFALRLEEEINGREHTEVAKILASLGTAYIYLGNAREAMRLLEHALAIEEKFYGFEHVHVAKTLGNIGNAYGELGNMVKKKELLEGVLSIFEKFYGCKSVEVANTLVNLESVYGNPGDVAKGKELLERALVILEEFYGPEHVQVAKVLNNLGLIYRNLGDVVKEKELLERAFRIKEEFYGPENIEVAKAKFNLGSTYLSLGDNKRARQYFSFAYEVSLPFYYPTHPFVREICRVLAKSTMVGSAMEPQEMLLLATKTQYKSLYLLRYFGIVCLEAKSVAGGLWYFLQAYNACELIQTEQEVLHEIASIIMHCLQMYQSHENDIFNDFTIFLENYPEIANAGATMWLFMELLNAYLSDDVQKMKEAQKAVDDLEKRRQRQVVLQTTVDGQDTGILPQVEVSESAGEPTKSSNDNDQEFIKAIELSCQTSTQEKQQKSIGKSPSISVDGDLGLAEDIELPNQFSTQGRSKEALVDELYAVGIEDNENYQEDNLESDGGEQADLEHSEHEALTKLRQVMAQQIVDAQQLRAAITDAEEHGVSETDGTLIEAQELLNAIDRPQSILTVAESLISSQQRVGLLTSSLMPLAVSGNNMFSTSEKHFEKSNGII